MKIISHRGNLNGVDLERENNPYYIDECIHKGFDVEIDLRTKDHSFFLGHDYPQYSISIEWLLQRKNNLWIHIKDFQSLVKILDHKNELKFFCHEGDKYTLISNNMIWSHDLENPMNNYCIIPLLSIDQVKNYNQTGMFGICTDYVYECDLKFK